MRIPSYDDLAPSIPDVSPLDVFASVERLMPQATPVTSREAVSSAPSTVALFACLYTPEPAPEARDRLVAMASAFSPRFERHGDAAVVLDVGGLGRLLGDAQAIGTELDRAARASGIRTHVAVAPTQTAAMLLAMARPTLTVVTADVASAIAPLPLAVLRQLTLVTLPARDRRVCGVRARSNRDLSTGSGSSRGLSMDVPRTTTHDPRSFDMLRRWGLTTIGELAALPPVALAERMGGDGPALHRRANGIDPRPLVPDPDAPRFIETMELEWPIDGLEPLSFVFARLLDPLSGALERADRGAAAVRLDLRLVDRSTHARVLQLPAAMRDARVLRTLLLLDLESNAPAAAIDAVTIEVDPAPARIIQFSLLERAMPSAETLATLTARLTALVGQSRCGTPTILDTHRPDGFEMWQFAESLGSIASKGSGGATGPTGSAKSEGSPVLRRFRPPVAVRVAMAAGRPVHVAVDRRGMPGGRVEQYSGPWRTSGGWWEGDARWDRDEWDLALGDGSLCRVYRDRIRGVWFLDGVFD
jgi:protein ImuB